MPDSIPDALHMTVQAARTVLAGMGRPQSAVEISERDSQQDAVNFLATLLTEKAAPIEHQLGGFQPLNQVDSSALHYDVTDEMLDETLAELQPADPRLSLVYRAVLVASNLSSEPDSEEREAVEIARTVLYRNAEEFAFTVGLLSPRSST